MVSTKLAFLACLFLTFDSVLSTDGKPTPSRCKPPKPPKPTEPPKSSTSTWKPECPMTICVDYVNECMQMYGGCYLVPECGGTVPTFTKPPCTTITPTPTPTSTTSTFVHECPVTLCVDYINECGMMYGGCYLIPECGGTVPTYSKPSCPTKTVTGSPTYTDPACTKTICTDRYAPCPGQQIGTCYLAPECGGTVPPPHPTNCASTMRTVTGYKGGYVE